MEAFSADVLLLPNWVQIWMDILGPVVLGSAVILLFKKETRLIGVFTLVGTILNVVLMLWIHGQLGFVKLLGLGHVIFWTPLVFMIWPKLKNVGLSTLFKAVLWILLVTLVVALAFDYADVIRWVLGNRAPVVSAT